SRSAGTGLRSASCGSQRRAARRVPSRNGISVCSISRTTRGNSVTITRRRACRFPDVLAMARRRQPCKIRRLHGGRSMSGSTKFLLFAIALVVAVVGYLAVDRLGLIPASRPATTTTATASAPPAAPVAAATPAPAPTAAAGAGSDAALTKAYEECV